METIQQKHYRLYTSRQLDLLGQLFILLRNQPVFISDIDPDSYSAPYFAAETYPLWDGGDNSLALSTYRYFKILGFTICRIAWPMGNVYWHFEGSSFKGITLKVMDEKVKNRYLSGLEHIASVLKSHLKCEVHIATTIGGMSMIA